MEKHYSRGHPKFREQEAVDFIKSKGVVTTGDLTDRFDVTDVAIRDRMKRLESVQSRKIRGQHVWFVPHEVESEEAVADGGILMKAFDIFAVELSAGYIGLGKQVARKSGSWSLVWALLLGALLIHPSIPRALQEVAASILIICLMIFVAALFTTSYYENQKTEIIEEGGTYEH